MIVIYRRTVSSIKIIEFQRNQALEQQPVKSYVCGGCIAAHWCSSLARPVSFNSQTVASYLDYLLSLVSREKTEPGRASEPWAQEPGARAPVGGAVPGRGRGLRWRRDEGGRRARTPWRQPLRVEV